MQVIDSIADFKKARARLVGRVGFVPTMGFLHEGHLSLVKMSKNKCDNTVVSIYVNPAQFAPNEDFGSYPRNLEQDLKMLEEIGVDLVFTPSDKIMYPEKYTTWIRVEDLDKRLEAESRPHFFTGVATIVNKLFNIVQPTDAFFGQKDAQQLLIIRKMVEDLNLGINIIGGEIIREPDGLAMSSRNKYLNWQEREAATVLYRTLKLAQQLWEGGEHNAEKIRTEMLKMLSAERRARIDYVSIADPETLLELDIVASDALVSLAVWVGKTRLIDNIILT